MLNLVRARIVALLLVLGDNAIAAAPLAAAPQRLCSVVSASALRDAADRYRDHEDFVRAALSYEAAARATAGCADIQSAIVGARSLLQAGTVLAQTGEYKRALDLVQEAHDRLHALTGDVRGTADARALGDIADELGAAIRTAAHDSM